MADPKDPKPTPPPQPPKVGAERPEPTVVQQQTLGGRRRFGDGESTVIMPLAEILRSKHAQTVTHAAVPKAPPPDAEAPAAVPVRAPSFSAHNDDFGSQSTVIMRMPKLPPRGTAATTGSTAAAKPGAAAGTPSAAGSPIEATEVSKAAAPAAAAAAAAAAASAFSAGTSPTGLQARPPAPVLDAAIAAAVAPDPVEAPLPPTVPSGRNTVLVFFACKGGCGSTALSVNVAAFAALQKKASCLVDLDLQFGDGLAALGLSQGLTIAAALEEGGKQGALGAERLARHPMGLSVLSQAGSLDDLDKIHSEQLGQLIDRMRSNFDAIVCDGIREFSDNALAVLDVADKIALVTTQEVLSLRRARSAYGILRKIGFDPADIVVVANQMQPERNIQIETLKGLFVGTEVVAVPDDRAVMQDCLDRGAPFIRDHADHPIAHSLNRLAAIMLGLPVPPELIDPASASRGTFWSRKSKGPSK